MDKEMLSKRLSNAAAGLIQREAEFCELDAKFGDGDHGITVAKVAHAINDGVAGWGDQSLQAFFEDLGDRCMNIQGGACGSLWGTLLGGMALGIPADATQVDVSTLKSMFQSGLDELMEITHARVGNKTMMDALIPAVEAIQTTQGDVQTILDAAAKAADEGARNTANCIAKFGRAKNYKERSLGTMDAGAVSTAEFFAGFARPID